MYDLLQEQESTTLAEAITKGTLGKETKMTRSDVEAELISRCRKDGKLALLLFGFRGNLYSRIIYGQAIAKGLGISLSYFLQQIERVQVLQETPHLLYLVLPVCHLGCQVSPVISDFQASPSCPVCGMFRVQCANSTTSTDRDLDRPNSVGITRKEIEEQLIIKAQTEPLFKQKLLSQGKATIIETLKAWGIDVPEFLKNIEEVRVVEETPNLLYMVFPVTASSSNSQ